MLPELVQYATGTDPGHPNMIVVKIELWPKGFESRKREIGRMHITNEAGTLDRGWYDVKVMRRGTTDKVQRTGEVNNYPRNSYSVWRLVMRALKSAFPEER